MDLQFALRQFSLLPRFIQTGNGEPRKAHFLGKQEASQVEGKQDQGRKNDNPPPKTSTSKYRSIDSITIGEVEQVIVHFKPQLVPSPAKCIFREETPPQMSCTFFLTTLRYTSQSTVFVSA